MPIRLVIGGESPFHGLPRQACPHMRVVRDISIIVVVEKLVVDNGVVEREHNEGQQQAK
jgi:hypothetical protein